MPGEKDTVFGDLCVQQGYLTPEQLDEVLEAQEAAAKLGMELSLADVLVSKKMISSAQRDEVARLARIHMGEAHLVGGYEVISKLGEGGMGVVYKARATASGALVALKVLPPALARNVALLRRFQREAELTRNLEHENIVRLVEFGLDRERKLYYCALEFIEGEDLAKILARQGRLPERRALEIARDIARALDHATSRGLVHRDVKPQNIMLLRDGTPKLLDLGLARSVGDQDTRLTQEGMFVGSPHYASPEQAQGVREQDVRTDIYSLGATLYHMVTGGTPFPGETAAAVIAKVVSERLPWPAEVVPELSEGCCTIIEKAMTRSPEHRYQTAAALIADVDAVLGGGPVAPLRAGESVVARPGRAAQRRGRATARHAPVEARATGGGAGMYVAVGAGIAILAAGAGFVLFGRSGETPKPAARPVARPAPAPAAPSVGADQEREVQEMFAFAEAYAKEHPEDFELTISNYEKVREAGRGTRFELEADLRVREVKERWREAALAAFEERKAKAAGLAGRGDFDAALGELEGVPGALASRVERELRDEAGRLRAEAAKRIDAALAEATELLEGGDAAGAEKALAGLEAVRFAEAKAVAQARVDALRARASQVEEEQRAAAAKKADAELPRILDEFDALVDAGDYAKAHALAARSAEREDLGGVRETLSAAAGVASALVERRKAIRAAVEESVGKEVSLRTVKSPRKGDVVKVDDQGITLRTKVIINKQVRGTTSSVVPWADLSPDEEARLAKAWEPPGADGDVARAVVEVARGRADEAEKALEPAKAHPLAARVSARIDVLRMGAEDAAALAAWRGIEERAAGKLTTRQAKALVGEMDAFEKEHGKTKFFESLGAKYAELRSRVEAAVFEWVDVPPARIPVKYFGQGRHAVEGDALVVRAEPGQGNHAEVSLLPNSRDFRVRFEYSGPLLEFWARRTNWRGSVLCTVAPRRLVVRTYPREDQNVPMIITTTARRAADADGWHVVEVVAKGRTFTLALDGNVVAQTDALPVAAFGDAFAFVWPQGPGLRFRNLRYLLEDPAAGVTTGIIAQKNHQQWDWIEVRADGEPTERRYVPFDGPDGAPDRKTLQVIRDLVTTNLVRLSWKLHDWRPRIVAVEVVAPAEKQGSVAGAVVDKGKGWVDVRPEGGPTERYIPRWIGGMPGDGGGPDKPVLREIDAVNVGDEVKGEWVYDDRKRVTSIEPVAGAAGPKLKPGEKFRSTFDDSTDGWFIPPGIPFITGELSLATKKGLPAKGRGALAISYRVELGKISGAIRPSSGGINHVSFWARTTNQRVMLLVDVEEQDQSAYNTIVQLAPADGWKQFDFDLDTFKLGDDKTDENGVLDFDQITSLVIADLSGMPFAGGAIGADNVLLLDEVVGEFRDAGKPRKTKKGRDG